MNTQHPRNSAGDPLDCFGYGSDHGYKTTTRRTFDSLPGHGSEEMIRVTVEDLVTGEVSTRDYLANLVTPYEAVLDLLSIVTTGYGTLGETDAPQASPHGTLSLSEA